MKELKLPWTKLKRVTTHGAPSMYGKKTGLMNSIRRKKDKQNLKFYVELHCIIHQQLLCGKSLKFEHVMQGRLVPCRSPMAESSDSAETFFSFEARNRNVHE
jgi:hypothetical protein